VAEPSWLEWLPQVAPEPAVYHEPELYPSRLSVDVEREDARVSPALRGELDLARRRARRDARDLS
jgi:hypothetical protein